MYKEKEERGILSKTATGKKLLRAILPLMRKALVGLTMETEEGLVFTLPGGKQYKILAYEV